MGLLGWALVGGVSLVAACGGSSDAGGDPGGGAGKAGSSSAGSSSAGTSSSAGNGSGGSRASGGTSSAGTASGGRATGGTPGTAGFNVGGFNLGGEGFDPSDFNCESPPEVGAACAEDAVPCLDGTNVCYCDMSKWACTSVLGGGGGAGGTGPIGNVDCPAAKPTTGTPCGDSVGFCPYGSGQFSGCACYQGSWACL